VAVSNVIVRSYGVEMVIILAKQVYFLVKLTSLIVPISL